MALTSSPESIVNCTLPPPGLSGVMALAGEAHDAPTTLRSSTGKQRNVLNGKRLRRNAIAQIPVAVTTKEYRQC
jgi:hypothetical protein